MHSTDPSDPASRRRFVKTSLQAEYDSLDEEFENNEQKHFGKGGFETMLSKVGDIEKHLGIFDLDQFTPA